MFECKGSLIAPCVKLRTQILYLRIPMCIGTYRGQSSFIIQFEDDMSASCLTSSTPVAEIREPPNVAQTHSTADASQGELYLPAPRWPV